MRVWQVCWGDFFFWPQHGRAFKLSSCGGQLVGTVTTYRTLLLCTILKLYCPLRSVAAFQVDGSIGRWKGGGGAPVSGECIRRLPWRSHGRELRRCDAPSEASEGGGRVLVGLGLSSARWCEWTRFLSTQQAAAYTASMACVVGLSPIRPWPCRPAAHEAVRPRLALSLSPLRAKV